eukprot:TRINITY_DN544_c0_g1_i1.p1 TRINITY_DN544_c0_g1~~TRINITY_DN544_c0_g1_i1.p1  ORF type:complete len:294 (+),score=76.61 TRINITY_DN544_c0_g1_i1:1164-2045(+)
MSPYFIPKILINSVSGFISKKYNINGQIGSSVLACASGSDAIIQGFRLIRDSSAKIVICGASEASICPITFNGFSKMRALSKKYNEEPEKASRPFSKDRDGFVIGEGAGIVILEDYEHAKERNADIYCELRSIGSASDAYHVSRPREDGIGPILSMTQALERGNLMPYEIDYINCHATSTPIGDQVELKAIQSLFNTDSLPNNHRVAVGSFKGHFGHLLGAAGAVEAVLSIKSLKNNIIPSTLNLDIDDLIEYDNKCINILQQNDDSKEINAVMSNSFGFGGANTSLLFTTLD